MTGIVRIHAAMSGRKTLLIRCGQRVLKRALCGSDHKRLEEFLSTQLPQQRRSRSLLSTLPKLAAAAAIGLTAFAHSLQPASAQGEIRANHGDWQMRCDTPPGAASEQCALIQNVTAADRENVGLSVIILRTADKQARILRVLAPLGVLLPSGLGLKVDGNDIGRAGFVRCLPNGCIAEVILEDELLNQLKSGSQATFIIFQTPEEGIGIPISLNGFSAGFDALP